MASQRIEVRPCLSEDEERLSLEIHNAVWPRRAVTMDEVRSFSSSTVRKTNPARGRDRDGGRARRPAVDLGEEVPVVVPRSLAERPELARGIYEVAVEAYADVPGGESEEMESFEDWLAHDMQGSGDRPDATFVALAGDEVVGYAKYSLTAARPTVVFHDMTGVRRDWRGRGIARVLKHAQIAWAKRSGFEELETSNEERNEPIRRLNAQLGYRPAPGRVLLEGPLAGPARS